MGAVARRDRAELQTVPGIWRDAEEEERAFRKAPLHDYFFLHVESQEWILRRAASYIVPTAGRLQRAIRHARVVRRGTPAQPAAMGPEELARAIRAEAERCGLSAIGFAPYDPKYIFSEYAGRHDEGTVIVCVLEQDYAATQTAPSEAAERAAMHAYAEVVERAARAGRVRPGTRLPRRPARPPRRGRDHPLRRRGRPRPARPQRPAAHAGRGVARPHLRDHHEPRAARRRAASTTACTRSATPARSACGAARRARSRCGGRCTAA